MAHIDLNFFLSTLGSVVRNSEFDSGIKRTTKRIHDSNLQSKEEITWIGAGGR
jgi:hypothetical protein